MSDLISRQAVLKELPHALWGKEWDEALAKAIIESVPTIDPVKHGKWIDREKYRTTKDGVFHTYRFKVCSECGRSSGRRFNRVTNYCPNCGASMERGEE